MLRKSGSKPSLCLIVFLPFLALAGCGGTAVDRAATGALAGAAVGGVAAGPIGIAAGGLAGGAVGAALPRGVDRTISLAQRPAS